MSKHLNDGRLRAALDGEVSPAELQHLQACASCRARQDVVQTRVQQISHRLASLTPATDEAVPAARMALSRLHDHGMSRKEPFMFRKIIALPFVSVGAIVILLLAVVLAVPSTRALADQFLNLFRVRQVTVIPVDFTGLEQLAGSSALGQQISQLISSSITMTKKPGAPVEAVSPAQASELAGLSVRLPQGMTPSRISVMNPTAFTFTVDRAKAQALLDEAGRSDLVLPKEVDGARIDVSIPAVVSVSYGTCPAPRSDRSGPDIGSGSSGRRYPDCVIMVQAVSPTVDAPPSVDVAQLAQIGLEFTGMSAEQAAAFARTVDWASTLVVPIPKNGAIYEQVTVDGVTGTLIQRPADDAPQYALLWAKDGVLYAISGLGTNSQQAMQMANSLP